MEAIYNGLYLFAQKMYGWVSFEQLSYVNQYSSDGIAHFIANNEMMAFVLKKFS